MNISISFHLTSVDKRHFPYFAHYFSNITYDEQLKHDAMLGENNDNSLIIKYNYEYGTFTCKEYFYTVLDYFS